MLNSWVQHRTATASLPRTPTSDALATHNGNSVPFAPGCVRVEQGVRTGFSGDHLRRSLNRGLQFRIIAATTDRSYASVGDEVHASFTVVTKVGIFGRRVAARVDEVFLIPSEDCTIHHIRASFRPAIDRR